MPNLSNLERDIKKELRASMNGILSAQMRNAGMPFNLIYGTELPRLQDIAREFPADAALADHLWHMHIRETRLLALMIMPPEAFSPEQAEEWGRTMVTAEEAQLMAMLLLSNAPQAKTIATKWLNHQNELRATCGALCLRHLIVRGKITESVEWETLRKLVEQRPIVHSLHLKKSLHALAGLLNEKKDAENGSTIN